MMQRLLICALIWICHSAFLAHVHAAAPTAVTLQTGNGYTLYRSGPEGPVRTAPRRAGLMMIGGGDSVPEAFRWLFEQGGHGRLVILRVSGAGELNSWLMDQVGGVGAIDTLVFTDAKASEDPKVVEIIDRADMIFIAGGDQAKYLSLWSGTPVLDAINAHVLSGRPIGGTSAGMAILGAWLDSASGSTDITATEALANPVLASQSLVNDFLAIPFLSQVITDSHFMARDRLGRMVARVAALRVRSGNPALFGLGLDEATAVVVDAQGNLSVLGDGQGKVWLIEASAPAAVLEAGKPLSIDSVVITGLGPKSRFNLGTGHREAVAEQWQVSVHAGVLQRASAAK